MAANSHAVVDQVANDFGAMKPDQDFTKVAAEVVAMQKADPKNFNANLADLNSKVDMKKLGFDEDFSIVGVRGDQMIARSEDGSKVEFRNLANMNSGEAVDNVGKMQPMGEHGRQMEVRPDGSATYTAVANNGDCYWRVAADVLQSRNNGTAASDKDVANFVNELAAYNGKADPNKLAVGEKIEIPPPFIQEKPAKTTPPTDDTTPPTDGTTPPADGTTPPAVADNSTAPITTEGTTVTPPAGDAAVTPPAVADNSTAPITTEGTTVTPPAGDAAVTPPAVADNATAPITTEGTTVTGPAGESVVVPPASDAAVVPPVSDTTVVPPVSDTTVVPPVSDAAVVPPASDAAVVPPVSDTTVVPPVADGDLNVAPPVGDLTITDTTVTPPVTDTTNGAATTDAPAAVAGPIALNSAALAPSGENGDTYNFLAPPGLNLANFGESWDGTTRGFAYSRNLVNGETDDATGNKTNHYTGSLDNGWFIAFGANKGGYRADETVDANNNLVKSHIYYESGWGAPSFNFQTPSGPQSIEHVSTVDTTRDAATGNYSTVVETLNGQRYQAITGPDGKITDYKQIADAPQDPNAYVYYAPIM